AVVLSAAARGHLSEQVGARSREPLEQFGVAVGWSGRTRHGRGVRGHRVSKVITSYSHAPHKFAGLVVCLRNFSQAGSLRAATWLPTTGISSVGASARATPTSPWAFSSPPSSWYSAGSAG